MKKLIRFRRFPATLLAALCCLSLSLLCMPAGPAQTTSEYEPGSRYEYRFSDLGLSMPLPANATVFRVVDEPFRKHFEIFDVDFEDGFYAVMLVKAGDYFGLDPIQQMDDEALQAFVAKWFGGDTSQSFTRVDDFLPGRAAVRAERTEGSIYGAHMIARVDDCVVDVMAGRRDGVALVPESAVVRQEDLLRCLMRGDEARPVERHITMQNDGYLDFPLKTRSIRIQFPDFEWFSVKRALADEWRTPALLGKDNARLAILSMLSPYAQGDETMSDLMTPGEIAELDALWAEDMENKVQAKGHCERMELGTRGMSVLYLPRKIKPTKNTCG